MDVTKTQYVPQTSQLSNSGSTSSKANNLGQISQPAIFNQKPPINSTKNMSESRVKKSNTKSSSFFDNLFKKKPKPLTSGKIYYEGDVVLIEGVPCSLTFA